ncbi:MAG: translation initiation factor IF-2 [Ruminococcaceae bacterium]|nr:translation initiation factor IF-2 [Oscillospiraceae bacterium]
MAINPQYKVNKMAKDLGLKSKDLSDILADAGKEVKTQRTLEPVEFDILFETLTRNNQITNIEDYLDGVTKIPSKVTKTAQPVKEEAAPKAEPKVEAKAEPKVETKAEVKAEDKPAAPAPKAETKTEPKTEVKAAPKAHATPAAPKAAPAAPKAEAKPAPKAPAAPAAPKAPAASTVPKAPAALAAKPAPATRPAGQGQGGYAPRPQGGYQNNNAPRTQQGQASGQGGFGQARNQGGFNSNTGNRPGQGSFGTQNRPAQGGFGSQNRPAQGGFGGFGGDRNDRGGNRPQQNRPAQGGKGGNHAGGGFDKDKEYQQVGGLKETFRPQATIRVTNTNTSPSQRGGTRVVDTRGSAAYDPSKYDEKLETFVSERDEALRGGNGGKMKRQQPGAARGTSSKNNFKGGKNKKMNEPAHILPTSVTLPEEIIVSDLASALKVKTGEVVKALMMMGIMATVNQIVDFDTAYLVADSLGIAATKQVVVSIEEKLFDEAEDTEDVLETRAPVVCVMGHVDHGKTSLLDAIRHTHVTAGEAGGITQHIGAYRVKVKGQDITFLDTPGHEAFTAMRARGAQSTDIAILVVAADDGIMPQTIEAINHAKAAGIDIIVAINKMDKPTANPEQVKQELTQYELVPEEWGGDVICVPVSAMTGMGIDDLLENVLLVAEVKDLKANPNRRAKGLVIEAKLDKGRGPVATVLVQNGTLHDGDIVIAGTAVGRVRAMTDHRGKAVKAAGPSVPVEIIGLAEVPTAGDEFQAVEDERMARTLADNRKNKAKEEGFRANARANLNDLFAQISDGVKTLNVIVKADVVGSAEAVKASLLKISNEEVKVSVIHSAAGGINEGDVMLAAASNAIVVGFNVRPDKTALDSAERQGVDIRTYRVIYDCIEEITAAMKGMLAPKFVEALQGHAEVRQTIHVPGVGTIAGSYVTDGKITRACKIRVLRDSVVIFEDEVSSLKRFKDDAREVAQGYECGIGLEKFNDIKVGDVLEAYIMEEVKA